MILKISRLSCAACPKIFVSDLSDQLVVAMCFTSTVTREQLGESGVSVTLFGFRHFLRKVSNLTTPNLGTVYLHLLRKSMPIIVAVTKLVFM